MQNLYNMKIIGVIPARYQSSRFPGKPLADICGKPMIWWVYQQAQKVEEFEEVVVATDDNRIADVCKQYDIKVVMTSDSHPTHVHRIHEVSEKIAADYYVVVCGDEPLISVDVIKAALPRADHESTEMYVGGLCRYFTDPAEVIDPANIKVFTNDKDECILLSRAAVPFPYKPLESIEDVTLQRFLENKIHIIYRLVDSVSLSVDTPHDLEKVIDIIKKQGLHGE